MGESYAREQFSKLGCTLAPVALSLSGLLVT